MKVLIIGGSNSRNSGGVFNAAITLGLNLKDTFGVDVHYLMYNDEYSPEDIKYYQTMQMHIYSILGPRKLGYSTNLSSQIRKVKPDLIHTQSLWMYLSYATQNYHSKTNIPYIISPHGMLDAWQLRQSVFKKKIALSLFENKHLIKASCIQALCLKEYYSFRHFKIKNPIAIIPNGVKLPDDKIANSKSSANRADRNKQNIKSLLFLSRIHPKKGLKNLLYAWSFIEKYHYDWELVIAGETSDKSYMEIIIRIYQKLKLTNVRFIGGQFDKNKQMCYLNADAFILPSFSEGLPIAVLEAWSFALPAILTPECNLVEGFEAGAAIKIESSIDGIASGILTLIKLNECDRLTMGLNGYNLVKDKFTWEKVAENTMELYEWVRGKRDKPAFVIDD